MRRFVSNGAQPGLPVFAKRTQAPCMASARAVGASGPFRAIAGLESSVWKTKATSFECAAPRASPDFPRTGLFQSKEYAQTLLPAFERFSSVRFAGMRKIRSP